MYFDNFLKNSSIYANPAFQQQQIGNFTQSNIPNYQQAPYSNKVFFQPKQNDISQRVRPQPIQHLQQSSYQTGANNGFQSNLRSNSNFPINKYQSQSNNTSFKKETVNPAISRDNNEFIKRRQSISFNNMYKQNDHHSPINKNYENQNATKTFIRTTLGNEHVPPYLQNMSKNTSIHGSPQTINKQIDNPQRRGNEKQSSQQKFYDKIGYQRYNQNSKQVSNNQTTLNNNNSKYSNYSVINSNQPQSELNSVNNTNSQNNNLNISNNFNTFDNNPSNNHNTNQNTYFASSNPSDSNKTQSLLSAYREENSQKFVTPESNNNDLFYKFKLKNVTSEFNKGNDEGSSLYSRAPIDQLMKKDIHQHQQYSTVSNIKKNQSSRISQKPSYNEREMNLTERQMAKSPSHNDLFRTVGPKDTLKLKNQCHSNYAVNSQESSSQLSGKRLTQKPNLQECKLSSKTSENYKPIITDKPGTYNSNSHLEKKYQSVSKPSEQGQRRQGAKNYQALIQNLQKKFTEQKNSQKSLQLREKGYVSELKKKEERIRQLQSQLLIPRQQKSASLSSNTKLLNEQLSTTGDSSNIKDLQIEQLKNENMKLKEQHSKLREQFNKFKQQSKRNRKKSGILTSDQTVQKDVRLKLDIYDIKIKELQNIVIIKTKEKDVLHQQISKLRESNSNLHQDYNHERKESQRLKDMLAEMKSQKQLNEQEMRKKSEQVQRKHDEIKNQLRKYLNQKNDIQKLERQKNQLQKQRQTSRLQNQRLQLQINSKKIILNDLQRKISINKQSVSEQQSQKSSPLTFKKESKGFEISQIYAQQLQLVREKLKQKEEQIQRLNLQVKTKDDVIGKLSAENKQFIQKIQIINSNRLCVQIQDESKQNKLISLEDKLKIKQLEGLLQQFYSKYKQIAKLFSLAEDSKTSLDRAKGEPQLGSQQCQSLTSMPHEQVDEPELQPSPKQASELVSKQNYKDYIQSMHPIIVDQIQKIHKDLKKLLSILKQTENQMQQKNKKLYELDKTLKKQGIKINNMLNDIHIKNLTIMQINRHQVQRQIFKLNQKYEILQNIAIQN